MGYCGIARVYYEKTGLRYPNTTYICGERENNYSIINENQVSDIANNVVLQSWQNLNTKMKQSYDESFIDLYDYDLSNVMISSAIHLKLNDKNLRVYIYSGRLIT